MARYNRTSTLSVIQQKLCLQRTYPQLIDEIRTHNNELMCIIRLQPTPQSIEYKVRIWFKPRYWPKAFLLEPKEIAKVNGKKPHHLYNRDEDGKERLCVFYPKGQEWNDNMFLAESFVPWVITWLSAYEIWQITGIWVYPEQIDAGPKTEPKKE